MAHAGGPGRHISLLLALTTAAALGGPATGPAAEHAPTGAGDGERVVTRMSGPDRVTTAIALSQRGWPAGADSVVVATAADFPDAVSAGALAAALHAPILLSPPTSVPAALRDELLRLGPDRVILVGGHAALGSDVESRLRDEGHEVERIAGVDRFETAGRVAVRAGAPALAYAVVSGAAFPDALSAGALITTPSRPPVLLASREAVPAATASAIDELGADSDAARPYLIGGTGALSEGVERELAGSVDRLWGPTRYATSQAVLERALEELDDHPRPLIVATGADFPDALAAAGLAARLDAPMLLVPRGNLTDGLAEVIAVSRHRLSEAFVVGGTTAVSEAVRSQVERLLNGLPARPHWTPDIAAARAYADGRSGSTSFAVFGTDWQMAGHHDAGTVPAASVMKVMFMVAYLRQPAVRDRGLSEADTGLLEPMIRHSANEPATEIANALGPGPMHELAELAGMRDFAYTRPWGSSRTSARDQARFMLDLGRLLPATHRDYALRLLTEIVPEQRWGVGEVTTPGWTKHFKGGWGSGTGGVNHQVVLLRHETGARAALAVMTTGSPSHDYSAETLREVFTRLLETLPG